MRNADAVQLPIAKNPDIIPDNHDRVLRLNAHSVNYLTQSESIDIHPERLLWIDTINHIAVIAALLLPKSTHNDFAGRLALGFRTGLTKRDREYTLSSFDNAGVIQHSTPLLTATKYVIFGRQGLVGKYLHPESNTEILGHTPSHNSFIAGIAGQVGDYTSDQHVQISFENGLIRIKDISDFGTLACTA